MRHLRGECSYVRQAESGLISIVVVVNEFEDVTRGQRIERCRGVVCAERIYSPRVDVKHSEPYIARVCYKQPDNPEARFRAFKSRKCPRRFGTFIEHQYLTIRRSKLCGTCTTEDLRTMSWRMRNMSRLCEIPGFVDAKCCMLWTRVNVLLNGKRKVYQGVELDAGLDGLVSGRPPPSDRWDEDTIRGGQEVRRLEEGTAEVEGSSTLQSAPTPPISSISSISSPSNEDPRTSVPASNNEVGT